jgi:hypothetical protein
LAQVFTGFPVGHAPEVHEVLNCIAVPLALPAPVLARLTLVRPDPEPIPTGAPGARPGVLAAACKTDTFYKKSICLN